MEWEECVTCYREKFEGGVGHATLVRHTEADFSAVGECGSGVSIEEVDTNSHT